MSSTILCITVAIFVLLSTSSALPIGGFHDNDTDITISSIINCSLTKEETDLHEIRAGHYVFEQYISAVLTPQSFCTSPVDIMQVNPITTYTQNSDVNSPVYLARWYTIFASFNEYLSGVKSSITSQEELNLLDTTQTLLDALQQSYFNVLQDRLCNCSEGCIIPELIAADYSTHCDYGLVNTIHFFFKHLIPAARDTLNKFSSNCDCQSPNGMTNRQWFEANFPTDNSTLYSLIGNSLPIV